MYEQKIDICTQQVCTRRIYKNIFNLKNYLI